MLKIKNAHRAWRLLESKSAYSAFKKCLRALWLARKKWVGGE